MAIKRPFFRKPIGFVGTSGTIFGGSRAPKGYRAAKARWMARHGYRTVKSVGTSPLGMAVRKARNAGSRHEAAIKAWITRRGG